MRDNYIFIQRNLNAENRNNGLIILEAYFGLDEHIYKVDAGILLFKIPKTVEEYVECQLVPLKKKLTIEIENS